MIDIVTEFGPHPYAPVVTVVTKPFWDALAEGRFLATAGTDGRLAFPPRAFDLETWSRDVRWGELSGRGTLYSVTEIHAAPDAFASLTPYCVCIVDLVEDIRLATRFLGPVTTPLDSSVELVAVRYDDITTFAARPAI